MSQSCNVSYTFPISMMTIDEMYYGNDSFFAGYSLVEEQYLSWTKASFMRRCVLSISTWIVIFGTASHHSFFF